MRDENDKIGEAGETKGTTAVAVPASGRPPTSLLVTGRIKWFDAARGFGFLTGNDSGDDILLHANVLHSFGQSSVAEGSDVEVRVIRSSRGFQAVEVLSIQPPETPAAAPIHDLLAVDADTLAGLPLLPARVKWFDKAKGFGFANLFGLAGDVFVHVDVLRASGLADLATGEAVGLRIVRGRRGMMAAQVTAWDRALTQNPSGYPIDEERFLDLSLVTTAQTDRLAEDLDR